MPAQIRWDPGDSAGERTLTGSPAICRFNRWRPVPDTIGERAIAVGDGVGYQWVHRTDYAAAFELPYIAHTNELLLQEFLLWANAFGVFAIDTADSESNTYGECQIAPGTRAEISDPDPETLEYTLTLTALNIAGAPIALRCVYA
jgi:hypothetical protein